MSNLLSLGLANTADNNKAFTLNGDKAFQTTNSALLDFFSRAASDRANQERVLGMFKNAFMENAEAATVLAFYLRDVRGGQMERLSFRTILSWLFVNKIDLFNSIVKLVPEYGYWKDILSYWNSPVVVGMVKYQLLDDAISDYPSLLAKWMPSENTSSKDTIILARKWARILSLSMPEYRKFLVSIRAKIGVVETLMSSKDWSKINFERVPSVAMKNYKGSFSRNAPETFVSYLESVKKGDKVIHSGTLFPHNLVASYRGAHTVDKATEAQWAALPNYAGDQNVLVMPDTSGSMQSWFNKSNAQNMDVSIALAIYFAEKNKGAFRNQFVTFSSRPKFITLKAETLFENIREVYAHSEVGSTDLIASVRGILDIALRNNVPQKDMPVKLLIISDMQFNSCTGNLSTFEKTKEAFSQAGYEMPEVVFWNMDNYENSPVTKDERGVALVSGASPSILQYVLTSKIVSPIETMLKVVNSERYKAVRLAL